MLLIFNLSFVFLHFYFPLYIAHQVLGEHHGFGSSSSRNTSSSMLEAAGLMRGAGTRIDVANKNIGAYKYSFNPLQVRFLTFIFMVHI
jgi:hypothetical protein